MAGQGQAGWHHSGWRRGLAQRVGGWRHLHHATCSTRWAWVALDRRPPQTQTPKLAAVALANKMARIAWKLMVTGESYLRNPRWPLWRARLEIARHGEQLNCNRAEPMPELARSRADGVIDRSKTRGIPLDPSSAEGRSSDWNLCRGNHLGQRSCASATTGRTYGRKRSDQSTAQPPCEERAVHIWIKEGKGAIKWTRLSCRSFAANAVRLQLHALAYNLGNFLRTLATPEPIKILWGGG